MVFVQRVELLSFSRLFCSSKPFCLQILSEVDLQQEKISVCKYFWYARKAEKASLRACSLREYQVDAFTLSGYHLNNYKKVKINPLLFWCHPHSGYLLLFTSF